MDEQNKPILVTKPFLPEKDKFDQLVSGIWDRCWLTNNGPLVNKLEEKLRAYIGSPYFHFLSNGTIALQLAMKSLEVKGEVITTPFSYVATTNSIIWEGLNPVFVDIDPDTWNIDPEKIEKEISNKTSAIVATHVFGNPCDVQKLEEISSKYDIPVIYDAAHAFGTRFKKSPITDFGDINTFSFHATKLFHTIEGGGIQCKNPDLFPKIDLLRNFGYNGKYNFEEAGINAKNSEFHAAMGLCNIEHVAKIIEKRKSDHEHYDNYLKGANLQKQTIHKETDYNYSYYPVVFPTEKMLLTVAKELENNSIYARRYFFPSLNTLKYVNTKNIEMPISQSISKRVLCLPLYFDLTQEDIIKISSIICQTIKGR